MFENSKKNQVNVKQLSNIQIVTTLAEVPHKKILNSREKKKRVEYKMIGWIGQI